MNRFKPVTKYHSTDQEAPISTPASIFEVQEAKHCPYVSLAVLYMPVIHHETWKTLLSLGNDRDDLNNGVMLDQLSDAASTLTRSQRSTFVDNLLAFDANDPLIARLIERIETMPVPN